MNRVWLRALLVMLLVVAFPYRSPAPLIYTPGEGWTYEAAGGEGSWKRTRAKDQLIVAQNAFDQKDYRLAIKAARRVVKVWPMSDYAAQAQYLVARGYEARGLDDRAFKEYQTLLDKYPKTPTYDEVLRRQYDIANLFLAGKWFRLFTYVPFFPSMEKTAGDPPGRMPHAVSGREVDVGRHAGAARHEFMQRRDGRVGEEDGAGLRVEDFHVPHAVVFLVRSRQFVFADAAAKVFLATGGRDEAGLAM